MDWNLLPDSIRLLASDVRVASAAAGDPDRWTSSNNRRRDAGPAGRGTRESDWGCGARGKKWPPARAAAVGGGVAGAGDDRDAVIITVSLTAMMTAMMTASSQSLPAGPMTPGKTVMAELQAAITAGKDAFQLPAGGISFADGSDFLILAAKHMTISADPQGTTAWFAPPTGGLRLMVRPPPRSCQAERIAGSRCSRPSLACP